MSVSIWNKLGFKPSEVESISVLMAWYVRTSQYLEVDLSIKIAQLYLSIVPVKKNV